MSTAWGNLAGDSWICLVWHDACEVSGTSVIAPRVWMRQCGIHGGFLMKPGTTLATTLFALASYPLLAQQPPPAGQPTSPAAQQQNPPGTATQNSQAAVPETPAVELSPVKGELI